MKINAADVIHEPLYKLAELIRIGQLSCVELVEEVLARIDRDDATLRAFIAVYREEALQQAHVLQQEIAAGYCRGVLHGVPIGIKDNIYTADRVTTMGSRNHADFVPTYNATVVDRLMRAGAIILGKNNLHEYALGGTTDNPFYGTCRNPWDVSKSPGGSSGGSAVATATGMVAAAIGTDTSGSIRVPASYCGVVGLKPTYGRVSRHGCFAEAWSLDHVGPITRSVQDAAMLTDVISGQDDRDTTCRKLPPTQLVAQLSADASGLRIGLDEAFLLADVDTEIARVVTDAVVVLRAQGAAVTPLRLPWLADCKHVINVIDGYEAGALHRDNFNARSEAFGRDVRCFLDAAMGITAAEYQAALKRRKQLQLRMAAVFETVDVLVAPTVPTRTPAVGSDMTWLDTRQVDAGAVGFSLVEPASSLGLPSLSLPCGFVDGLPVGLQLIGAALGEEPILRAGLCVEQAGLADAGRPVSAFVPGSGQPAG